MNDAELKEFGRERQVNIVTADFSNFERFIDPVLALSSFAIWVGGGGHFRENANRAIRALKAIRDSLGIPPVLVVIPNREQRCAHIFKRCEVVPAQTAIECQSVFDSISAGLPRNPLLKVDVLGKTRQCLITQHAREERWLKGPIWALAYAMLTATEPLRKDQLATVANISPDYVRILLPRMVMQLNLSKVGLLGKLQGPGARPRRSEGPAKYRLLITKTAG